MPLDRSTASLRQLADQTGDDPDTVQTRNHARALIDAGSRATACRHGYGVFDSCPVCD